MSEHPSLSTSTRSKSAQLQEPDAYTILAKIQRDITLFTLKYSMVLDKIEANAESEAELLASAKERLKTL